MSRDLPPLHVVQEMLAPVPSDERGTWIRVGMALRGAYGDDAFEVWNQWSSNAPNYKSKGMRAQWRSFRSAGGVTMGTVFHLARQYGWTPSRDRPPEDQEAVEARRREAEARRARMAAEEKREEERRARLFEAVVEQTKDLISQAEFLPHPYLDSKGFQGAEWLVYGTSLLLPMRDFRTNNIVGHQTIEADGTKKFAYGTRAKEAVFDMGNMDARMLWLCEGFATGWSIRTVMADVGIPVRVVVCFSAQNMVAVAGHTRNGNYFGKPVYVVADNDASGVGKSVAEKIGLPYWMPPAVGQDANDFLLEQGRAPLRRALLDLELDAALSY